ncbi:hypothetical protein P4234_32355 [Pseudomonas aeruginosa]|nr:hypothetical protein [Pseudomonas aeruginosa]
MRSASVWRNSPARIEPWLVSSPAALRGAFEHPLASAPSSNSSPPTQRRHPRRARPSPCAGQAPAMSL